MWQQEGCGKHNKITLGRSVLSKNGFPCIMNNIILGKHLNGFFPPLIFKLFLPQLNSKPLKNSFKEHGNI